MAKHDVVRSCPTCGDNLFTQGKFLGTIPPDPDSLSRIGHWLYRCGECGQHSKWSLNYPIPVYDGVPSYQDWLSLRRR